MTHEVVGYIALARKPSGNVRPFAGASLDTLDGAKETMRAAEQIRPLARPESYFIGEVRRFVPPLPYDWPCMTCTHKRGLHIYDEGACRPGFACKAHCSEYAPMAECVRCKGPCFKVGTEWRHHAVPADGHEVEYVFLTGG